MKIIPTIFAKNKKEFDDKLKKLVRISGDIQIDFMDGRFVSVRSVRISDVPNLKKYKKNFEAHLMVRDPETWINCLKERGFKKVLFHYESMRDINDINRIVFLIKDAKMKSWIVFNPETDFVKVLDVLKRVDFLEGVMFMGHKPGVEGRRLDINGVRRAMNLKRFNKKIKIQVDGGVSDKTISELKDVGVDIVNVGSFISKAKTIPEARKNFELLKKLSK